jgi:hypothetical protein
VLVSKWEPTALQPSNTEIVVDFQQAFQGPLDSAKRDALRVLMKFDVAGFECMFEEAC